MPKYVYDITNDKDLQGLISDIQSIQSIYNSMEFKKFIGKKCEKELQKIMDERLSYLPDYHVMQDKLEEYKKNHLFEYGDDYILRIHNSTNLEQDEMYWVSEETRERYPEGISISYIIEYGTGLMGDSQDDWQVNVPSPSKHKDGTWSFERDGVVYVNVAGYEGKYIYQRLLDAVMDNFGVWTFEYLEKLWR